jgi:citrate synthase
MSDEVPMAFESGLKDVVAVETRLSSVYGEAGELIIVGFPVQELAGRATLVETVYLLWNDALPNEEQLASFQEALAIRRPLPQATLDLLRAAAAAKERVPTMDALRMAADALDLSTPDDASWRMNSTRTPSLLSPAFPR